MNISPAWGDFLRGNGHETVHWSTVGSPKATDREIMIWARANGYVVFTHDLDFGAILAVTGGDAPSVIQLRAQDITPTNKGPILLNALRELNEYLDVGALIIIDENKSRVRVLPLQR